MGTSDIFCPYCRRKQTAGKFYPIIGIQNNDRLPICKECCKQKFDKYSSIVGEDAGAWTLMAELGVPFILEKWKTAKVVAKTNGTKGRTNCDSIALYVKYIKDSGTLYQGFWESDTMVDEIFNEKAKQSSNRDDIKDLEFMAKKWGRFDETSAYEFLEDTLNDYTEDLLEVDANLLVRYKDLCILEYYKRKAQEGGDISEIAKAQDRIDKQLKLLKLDDFKVNNQTEDEKHIERICWEIENTRPAECEDLEKYKDFSGFGKTIDHIMRCCKNLVVGSKEYPDLPKDD